VNSPRRLGENPGKMFAGRSAVELATIAIAWAVITTWVDLISGTPFARQRTRSRDQQSGTRHEMKRPRRATGAEEKNFLSHIDHNERRYQRHHESTKESPHAS
jgi:hypothetical protein